MDQAVESVLNFHLPLVRDDELHLASAAAAAEPVDAGGRQLLTVRGVRVAATAAAPGGPPLGNGAPLVSDAAVVALVPRLPHAGSGGGGGGGTVLRLPSAPLAGDADGLPLRLLQLTVPAAVAGGSSDDEADGTGSGDGGVRVAVPVTAVTRLRDVLLRALAAAGVQRWAEVPLAEGDDDNGGFGVAVLADGGGGGGCGVGLLSVEVVRTESAFSVAMTPLITLPLASSVADHRHLLSQPGLGLRLAVAAANVEALPPEAVAHLTLAGGADAAGAGALDTTAVSSSASDGGAGIGGVLGSGSGGVSDPALLLAGNFSFLSQGSGGGAGGTGIGAGVGGAIDISVLPQALPFPHPLTFIAQQTAAAAAASAAAASPRLSGLHGGAPEYRPWDVSAEVAAAPAPAPSPPSVATTASTGRGSTAGDGAWAPPGTPTAGGGSGGADDDGAGRGRVSPSTAQLQERVSGLVAALSACVAHLRGLLEAAKAEAGAAADGGTDGGGSGTPASAAGGSAGTPIAAAVGIGAAASEIEARWLADSGGAVFEGDGARIMGDAMDALAQLCALTFAREKGGGSSSAFYAQETARAERARHVVFSCGAVPLLLSVVRMLPADGKPALQTLEQCIQCLTNVAYNQTVQPAMAAPSVGLVATLVARMRHDIALSEICLKTARCLKIMAYENSVVTAQIVAAGGVQRAVEALRRHATHRFAVLKLLELVDTAAAAPTVRRTLQRTDMRQLLAELESMDWVHADLTGGGGGGGYRGRGHSSGGHGDRGNDGGGGGGGGDTASVPFQVRKLIKRLTRLLDQPTPDTTVTAASASSAERGSLAQMSPARASLGGGYRGAGGSGGSYAQPPPSSSVTAAAGSSGTGGGSGYYAQQSHPTPPQSQPAPSPAVLPLQQHHHQLYQQLQQQQYAQQYAQQAQAQLLSPSASFTSPPHTYLSFASPAPAAVPSPYLQGPPPGLGGASAAFAPVYTPAPARGYLPRGDALTPQSSTAATPTPTAAAQSTPVASVGYGAFAPAGHQYTWAEYQQMQQRQYQYQYQQQQQQQFQRHLQLQEHLLYQQQQQQQQQYWAAVTGTPPPSTAAQGEPQTPRSTPASQ